MSKHEDKGTRGKSLAWTGVILSLGLGGACGELPQEATASEIASPEIETHTAALTSTQLFGWNFTTPTTDSNRCVKNAATFLNRMNSHGENIGIHYKSAGYTPTDGTKWHAQSIVRLPFFESSSVLRGQWFVEDVDHVFGGASSPDSQGHLGVARMGFTGGNSGRLLGSNKTFNDGYNGSDWLVAPNPGDTFLPVNGTSKFHIDELQNHPGGMSGIGQHVAIALMQWAYPSPFGSGYIPAASRPVVKIFDHQNPQSPVLRQTFTTFLDSNPTGNDAVAISKLRDGRFLLAVEKGGNLLRTEFYISNGTSLSAPNLFGNNQRTPDAVIAGYQKWTSMNFITDCDSSELFVIGFHEDGNVDNRLVKFFQNDNGTFSATFSSPPVWNGLAGQARKPLACTDNQGNGQCSLTSSAGSYVDPDGKVILYVMGGDDDGCIYSPSSGSLCGNNVRGAPYLIHGNGTPTLGNFSASTGYMRGMEFHERHGNYAAGSDCPTLDTGWVELYENENFNSGATDTTRNYFIQANKATEKPSYSLGPNYFNDLASSVRWCLPPGTSFTVFDAVNFLGPSHVLSGTGYVQKIPTFVGKNYSHGGGSMNNRISSYKLNNTDNDPLKDQGAPDDSI